MRSRMYSRSQSVWLFPIWLSDECRDGCEKLNKRHNPSNIVNKSCTSTICQRPPRGGLSALGASKTDPRFCCGALVASLIGRLGSSAFRLSTSAVSMSLTGSRFSSESAPRPFHHGIRRRGGTIYWTALPSDEWQVQATKRTHLIHRPARDIIPPLGGARVFSYCI